MLHIGGSKPNSSFYFGVSRLFITASVGNPSKTHITGYINLKGGFGGLFSNGCITQLCGIGVYAKPYLYNNGTFNLQCFGWQWVKGLACCGKRVVKNYPFSQGC